MKHKIAATILLIVLATGFVVEAFFPWVVPSAAAKKDDS